MIIFTSNVAEGSIFNWFDDTESQTEFLTNPLYQNYLKKYNGNFYSQFGMWIGWSVIKTNVRCCRRHSKYDSRGFRFV